MAPDRAPGLAALGHGYPFPLSLSRAPEPRPPLITDGGRHSAEGWAAHVAEWFLSPAPGAHPDREDLARRARERLEPVFRAAIETEARLLARQGGAALAIAYDFAGEAGDAVAQLADPPRPPGSNAKPYWSRPEIRRAAVIELAHHLRSAAFVERAWWAAEHPDDPAAVAFRARHYPEPAGA